MCQDEKEKENCKILLSGQEIVALAGSVAICLSEKYEKEDIKKLKLLFSAIITNLTVIENDKKC